MKNQLTFSRALKSKMSDSAFCTPDTSPFKIGVKTLAEHTTSLAASRKKKRLTFGDELESYEIGNVLDYGAPTPQAADPFGNELDCGAQTPQAADPFGNELDCGAQTPQAADRSGSPVRYGSMDVATSSGDVDDAEHTDTDGETCDEPLAKKQCCVADKSF
jgi:hypothetical protein